MPALERKCGQMNASHLQCIYMVMMAVAGINLFVFALSELIKSSRTWQFIWPTLEFVCRPDLLNGPWIHEMQQECTSIPGSEL